MKPEQRYITAKRELDAAWRVLDTAHVINGQFWIVAWCDTDEAMAKHIAKALNVYGAIAEIMGGK